MKKILSAAISFLIIISAFSGCKSSPGTPQIPDAQTPDTVEASAQIDENAEQFFKSYVDTADRTIAVMIDNDSNLARPQIGLNDAFVVYEIIVEGGATRFMALFKNSDTEKIGPVRSVRHYFLDYVKEWNPIFTHFGWSPKAGADEPKMGINYINGVLGGDGNCFWRDYSYTSQWHTAYTSIKNIREKAAAKGFDDTKQTENVFEYSKDEITPLGDSAVKITLPYSYIYTTGYYYDENEKLYYKTINSADHKMQDGNTVSCKNLIIQYVKNYSLGDGSARQDIDDVSSGKGLYITNGRADAITWSKAARGEKTKYFTSDGSPLFLNTGNTFVNIIDPSSGTTVQ